MKDYFGYEGKVCVVTGAASGMGKATSEILIDMGAKVYALDVAKIDLKGAKRIQVSLSDKNSIDEAFAKIPEEIDAFFGIAGVSGIKTDFDTTVLINFIANKYITDEYLTKRIKPGGSIVYCTSKGGLRWEIPALREEIKGITEVKGWDETVAALKALGGSKMSGTMGYIFSKRAMHYYIASIMGTFGEKGIRLNAVLPANTQTGLTDEFTAMKGDKSKLLDSSGYATRIAEAREMAEPIVFLGSDMASYVSGVLLDVDFGQEILVKSGIRSDSMGFAMFPKANE